MPPATKVLFLCTGNSARSQMAEGLLRSFCDQFHPLSAGLEPKGLNPLAVEAMKEIGIDLSQQKSKDVVTLLGQHIPYVNFAMTPKSGARFFLELTSSSIGDSTIRLPPKALRTKNWPSFAAFVTRLPRKFGRSSDSLLPPDFVQGRRDPASQDSALSQDLPAHHAPARSHKRDGYAAFPP